MGVYVQSRLRQSCDFVDRDFWSRGSHLLLHITCTLALFVFCHDNYRTFQNIFHPHRAQIVRKCRPM